MINRYSGCSAVGSASGLGPGGRRFESCHPDKKSLKEYSLRDFFAFMWWALRALRTLRTLRVLRTLRTTQKSTDVVGASLVGALCLCEKPPRDLRPIAAGVVEA